MAIKDLHVERIAALVEKWRQLADRTGWTGRERGQAESREECADELSTLLADLAREEEPTPICELCRSEGVTPKPAEVCGWHYQRLAQRLADEESATPPLPALGVEREAVTERAKAIATTRIVQRVAELPDRSSPDDEPEMMLVTSAELGQIVADELEGLVAALRSGGVAP